MAQPIDHLPLERQPVRDIRWVLRGAFTLAVFSITGLLLSQLIILTLAEQHLIQVAHAGAREAALPRATVTSVKSVVNQRWRNWSRNTSQLQVAVRAENRSLQGLLPNEFQGSIRVEVAIPSSAVLPRWMLPQKFWWGPPFLRATKGSNQLSSRS